MTPYLTEGGLKWGSRPASPNATTTQTVRHSISCFQRTNPPDLRWPSQEYPLNLTAELKISGTTTERTTIQQFPPPEKWLFSPRTINLNPQVRSEATKKAA